MSKEIKFSVKLVVDGKEQFTTTAASLKELRKNIDTIRYRSVHLIQLLYVKAYFRRFDACRSTVFVSLRATKPCRKTA